MHLSLATRGYQLWQLLRSSLHSVVEKEKTAELCETHLTHGLEPVRILKVAAGLKSVVQGLEGNRFVVLDGAGFLHLYRDSGIVEKKVKAPVALAGLVKVLGQLDAVSGFVGWGPFGLALLRPDFSLLWLSEPRKKRVPEHNPICCMLVPDQEQLLVAEAGGGLSLWKFHAGGHLLVPFRPFLQPEPSPRGALVRLVLGPETAQGSCCCFAVFSSEVFTFDLHTWTFTDVRRNLHKTTIMDLVYCGELKVTVTASRDSTVKVWEADWQIRMVFLSHTGPVTALALLPDTTLVVSASQDGTMRTWDLQEAAQVGEVVLDCPGPNQPLGQVTRLLPPPDLGRPLLSLRVSSVQLWRLRTLYSPLAQLSAPVLHLQVAPPPPGPMQSPLQPPLPTRLVCACADGWVYLVSVVTGLTVTALLLQPDDCAAAVAYCLPWEVLCVLTRNGHLVFATSACCPMRVLHRERPPLPPGPRPCCLHLYSHFSDPKSASDTWEMVRQRGAEVRTLDVANTWKDKNRYLTLVGHTNGTLAVLDLFSWKTTFHTDAHCPTPVTAIESTWNSVVTSGEDLMVKVWRIFPYAEESLSLLCTFASCHRVVALCILGRTIAMAFEDPNNATYSLVHLSLDHGIRHDHRPQDDPTDHITSLCCCPSLKLYASSSLDRTVRIWTAKNRLLRLMLLDGTPQALAFCGNSGDLVLALGSHLCLIPHSLYLPTFYLLKKLCQKTPKVVDDPPLPLTCHASLTTVQLQRLTLQGTASCRHPSRLSELALKPSPSTCGTALPPSPTTLQQPEPEEDLEALIRRDHDLQKLRLGLVLPVRQILLSLWQHQEAFENYLSAIYGVDLKELSPGHATQGWCSMNLSLEREASASSLFLKAEDHLAPEATRISDTPSDHPPRVSFPITPTPQEVHSKASQLLACSSLSSSLHLSLDLQLQDLDRRQEWRRKLEQPLKAPLQKPIPLLLKRRPEELVSKFQGFFPAILGSSAKPPLPIQFPGCVPNSVVLQQLWLCRELKELTSLSQMLLCHQLPNQHQMIKAWGKVWPSLKRWLWRRKLILYGDKEEEEEQVSDSGSMNVQQVTVEGKQELQVLEQLLQRQTHGGSPLDNAERRQHALHSMREERYRHLPAFLTFFVLQNWFKRLFPTFTLEAYPEMGTVDGLALQFMDLLGEASWTDRIHLLHALQRLLPSMSQKLRDRLHDLMVFMLNQEEPPHLEDETQKKFVMLALQLLLSCSLESREVIVQLLSYFLYSPVSCWPEIQSLLAKLGLCDPHGFLFKDMLTWVQGPDFFSKALLHKRCQQKLEELMQNMEMADTTPPLTDTTSELLSISAHPRLSKDTLLQMPSISKAPTPTPPRLTMVALPREAEGKPGEIQLLMPSAQPLSLRPTRHMLSEILLQFSSHVSHTSILEDSLPQEHSDWSRMQVLDLKAMDALNFFCEQMSAREGFFQPERLERRFLDLHVGRSLLTGSTKVVVPQTKTGGRKGQYRIHRLQEIQARVPARRTRAAAAWQRGPKPTQPLGRIRALKLPLPRAELRPFPPGWPRPARPLPPLLLQPALQRYFVPQSSDPDRYT
ncbi:WD repeat-containing protein 97 [Sorex araneus]|uniref:WD repeat-containing protein 97 n=1 Tax=Sorex araneus TaxID=42254 RepID=UPI002433C246|nr:WD repeat-containing protein 97 [Sorex araneus]